VYEMRAELEAMHGLSGWIEGIGSTLALGPERVYAVLLCLEEVVANVIMHGQPAGSPELVNIRISITRGNPGLRVTIDDNGPAFDPTGVAEPSRPSSLDAAPIGGVGLLLVREFSSSLSYARVDGMNRLEMAFNR
jgi:anti-sigma regulatory factor (Ser/Thr protein kinase)